jgi:Spy/CpxP family protein refolding chaperone
MNHKHPKFSPRIAAASLALSLGLVGSAFAMPPFGGDYGGHGGRGGMHGHMDHGMRGMSRLHDELKLDTKQEALWQNAEKAAREGMDAARERMRKQHEETLATLNQPGADLRAVLKRMDDMRAERQKQHDANRDRWLAVYDALNAEQKEKVRVFFKSRMEGMGRSGPGDSGRGGERR